MSNHATETKGTHPVRWRKKPVVIEAMHFHSPDRNCIGQIQAWISSQGGQSTWHYAVTSNEFQVKTLEGWHVATLGDYIIRGVHGEFYPCKPDIFAKTYEPPEQPPEPYGEQLYTKANVEALCAIAVAGVQSREPDGFGTTRYKGETLAQLVRDFMSKPNIHPDSIIATRARAALADWQSTTKGDG